MVYDPMPIIVLFLKNTVSLTQIMILQATYSFTVALFEIPSGFFADIYGRRLSLFFGSILTFLGYLIFLFILDLMNSLLLKYF